MARAKKATPNKQFVVGWSECGDLSQLQVIEDEKHFGSIEKAKASLDKDIELGELEANGTYFILQIVAQSKTQPIRVQW